MTGCECNPDHAARFWCARHQIWKTVRLHELCRTRENYFSAWEEGRGPGQNLGRENAPPDPLQVERQRLAKKEWWLKRVHAVWRESPEIRSLDQIVSLLDRSALALPTCGGSAGEVVRDLLDVHRWRREWGDCPVDARIVDNAPEIDAQRIATNRAAIRVLALDLAPRLGGQARPLDEIDRILAAWEIRCREPSPIELRIYATALADATVWRPEWGELGKRKAESGEQKTEEPP